MRIASDKVVPFSAFFVIVVASEAGLWPLRALRYGLTPFGLDFQPISLLFRRCKNPRSPFTEAENVGQAPSPGRKAGQGRLVYSGRRRLAREEGR